MNDFTDILRLLAAGNSLSASQARFAMEQITQGHVNTSRVAAFLFALSAKGETLEELTAFVQVLREASVRVDVQADGAVDVCGTGGDHTGTFNISTATMFVVAGADVPVLKHGNAGVSSRSGSYDVLASLGAAPALHKQAVERCFSEIGMAFMFAPLFHPVMKHVMPARRDLGVRTCFNIMGPMLNPAGVTRQVVGAFNNETAALIIRILQALGSQSVYAVHAGDGLDEITTTTSTRMHMLRQGQPISEHSFDPAVFGITPARPEALQGGSADENAAIIRAVLENRAREEQTDIVVLNAAFGIHASGCCDDLQEAYLQARESLESGDAHKAMERFCACTQDLAVGS